LSIEKEEMEMIAVTRKMATTRGRLNRSMLVILSLALIVAGCQSLNPYTDEPETSKTTKGAVIGTAAGAAVGAILTGGSRRGILLGAGIGALVGGGVGHYMDKQAEELRRELRDTGVSVTRHEDSIILNMPGNITFATDSSDVTADFYPVLNSVAIVLNKFDSTYVDVQGFTDSTGRAEYNQKLSERRAASVSSYIVNQNVTQARMVVTGLGQDYPVASNDTSDGRALNRRVAIVLTPLT
jgi:outer membrane protein OmpA-like peptidoglycan-associated protein